ncbi:hypothetical protein ACFQ9X_22700 [Catenulispora yoronensis]
MRVVLNTIACGLKTTPSLSSAPGATIALMPMFGAWTAMAGSVSGGRSSEGQPGCSPIACLPSSSTVAPPSATQMTLVLTCTVGAAPAVESSTGENTTTPPARSTPSAAGSGRPRATRTASGPPETMSLNPRP